MKKHFLIVLFFVNGLFVFSQNQTQINFNKWSLELGVGQNKAVRPFTSGYFTSNSRRFMNINGFEHFEIGTRYMFSTYFGLKLDMAYDIIKNNDNESLPFKTKQLRLGLQGIANLGRIMHFESFTSRLGLLLHGGVQISSLLPKNGENKDVIEYNGGILFGITPQIKLTNKINAIIDFTVQSNLRQHYNWDGSYAATDNNLTGQMYSLTLGLQFSLGKQKVHADWFVDSHIDIEAKNRLDIIEQKISDVDNDGVQDYYDFEKDTPAGVLVDSRGRQIDLNYNGIPDNLEKQIDDKYLNNSNLNFKSKADEKSSDVIFELIKKGGFNMFFDLNHDIPNSNSLNNLFVLINYLKENKNINVTLLGYTDATGDKSYNKKLAINRAKNIANIMINMGINENRISIEGLGVDQSIIDESNVGKSLARRVSIKIN